jgi:flagellar hook capping protein FlgD
VNPALQVSVNSVQVCDGQPGTLRATVSNGTAPYKCVWSTGATSESITTTRAGDYCVTVTDANGCQGKACGTLSHPELTCLIQGPKQGCYGKSATFTMGSTITIAKTGANAATGAGSRRFGPGLSASADVSIAAPATAAAGRTPGARGFGANATTVGGLTYVECWWSVDDPSVGQIVGPADQPTVTIQFSGLGSLTVTLHVESELGCSNTCSEEINVVDCDAANCPRTVGFWGQQCIQKDGGSAKFTVEQLERIVACVDARSQGLDLGTGRAGLDAFCALIYTDDMDQRHQAKRQFAALLANVCTGNLGLVTNNGEWVRLIEATHISCGDFHATTIGELIDEIDTRLLALEGRDLDAVKDQYAEIIHCADNMNNGIGILVSCTPGTDPRRNPPVGSFSSSFKTAPNPFSGTMSVLYAVAGTAVQPVSITVYDIAGRRVATLEESSKTPGQYVATWDGLNAHGTQMSRGVYFIRGVIGGQSYTSRVLLVR